MSLLKCWGFREDYFDMVRKEAFRRYGTGYGSVAKLLYELIDYGIQQSRLKPSFDELKDKPPFPGAQKNKKIGKVELRYYNIAKYFVDNKIDPCEHPKVLKAKVAETWRAKSTYDDKMKEVIKIYNEWMMELEG